MSKTPRNSLGTAESDLKAKTFDLAALHAEVVFLPSPAHRRVKSKFWQRYEDLGGPVSLELAEGLTKEPGLRKWWSMSGFKDWFLNQDEARERLEYLYMVALDAAEHLLLDPNANHNAKAQMIKIIAQLAGKEPNKYEKFADAAVQKMDSAKLRAYIEKEAFKYLKPSTKTDDESVDAEEVTDNT